MTTLNNLRSNEINELSDNMKETMQGRIERLKSTIVPILVKHAKTRRQQSKAKAFLHHVEQAEKHIKSGNGIMAAYHMARIPSSA